MEKRILGRTGMEVSVLGFGGAETGYAGTDHETVSRLLNAALDAGLNVIDTAECYGDGEEQIGRAVAHRRGDYFLFTKCGHASGFPDEKDWDPKMLARSIDRSLERLRTDHVDLIHLHSCGEDLLRQGDVIDVLRRARDAGKTRFVGYSGDSFAALYAVQCGAFDSLQTSVSVADQQCIDLTLPEAAKAGVGVVAKRPVANAAWRHAEAPGGYPQTYWERLQKLDYPFLPGDGGSTDEAMGTALRFTLAQPAVAVAIVGTANPDRWRENAALLEAGPLPPERVKAIRDRWHAVAGPDWVGQG